MNGDGLYTADVHRQVFERNEAVQLLIDPANGRIVEANPAACQFYGYSREELTRRRISEINILPEPEIQQAMALTLAQGRNTFQFRHRLASGEVRDVEVHAGPVALGDRTLLYSIVHDVTERSQAEETLQRQLAAFKASIDGMAILDPEGRYIFLNEAHARIYGYTQPSELIGHPWRTLYSGKDLALIEEEAMPALRRDGRWRGEAMGTRRDGTGFPQEISLTMLADGGLVCVVRDTTERRSAEDALKQSEERYRTILEQIEESYYETDLSGRLTFFNEALCRLLGREPDAVPGLSYREYTSQAESERLAEIFGTVYKTGRAETNAEWGILRPDGTRRLLASSVSLRRDAMGAAVGFLGLARDVTDQRLAETALRASEDRYRGLVELSPFGVAVHCEGKLVFLNREGANMLGAPSPEFLFNRPILDFVDPAFHGDVKERIEILRQGGEVPLAEQRFLRLDGTPVHVEALGIPFNHQGRPAVQVIFRNISRERRQRTLQAAMFRIAEITATVDDMEELYVGLHGVVAELMYARNFYIALQDHSTGIISFPYYVDEVDPPPPSRYPRPGLTEYVLRTGRPLLADPDTFRRLVAEGEVQQVGGASVDWLGVPLGKGEGVFGVLGVQSYSDRLRFKQADQEILTFVSQHVAAAIDRKRAIKALARSEARFRTLADTAPCAIFIHKDNHFLYVNDATLEITGRDRADLERCSFWQLLGPEFQELIREQDEQRQRGAPDVPSRCEVRLVRPDGWEHWLDYSAAVIEHVGGPAVLGTAFDITDYKRAEAKITSLAYHDVLTGLPNRLLFNDRLEIAVAQAHRYGHKLAVLFIDLDRFKVINDSMGHSHGDRLLKDVAKRLMLSLREGDTVARLGGDEFIIILPAITRVVDAVKVAEKILDALRQPAELAGREIYVTTSMGISLYPDDGLDAEALVKNADTAMYRAKEQGRDGYQLYTAAMNASALERLALENDLRKAVIHNELELHYQPVVDLGSGAINGVEALLRWRRGKSFIAPDDFVPIAELTGLIIPIGPWVLRRACAEIKSLENVHPGLCVSVNLSARQFQQGDLVAVVTQILEETGFEAHRLDLEITETSAMQNAESTMATLRDLKSLGVHLSIDDFGVGYSSLSYLKRLPIDTLKIDRSFVRDITTDPDDAAIATAVIGMAHALKLSVVAEGVETEEQLAFLTRHHCDRVQGYLFSAALPPDELGRLLAGHGKQALRVR